MDRGRLLAVRAAAYSVYGFFVVGGGKQRFALIEQRFALIAMGDIGLGAEICGPLGVRHGGLQAHGTALRTALRSGEDAMHDLARAYGDVSADARASEGRAPRPRTFVMCDLLVLTLGMAASVG